MTTTWALNVGDLITRSYRIIGNLTPPWTPTDDQMNQGLIAYNAMTKGWQTDGPNLWRQTQVTMTVPAGVGFAGTPFQLTPLVLALQNARWVINSQPGPSYYERPLGIYTYADYMNLPNKQAQSTSGPSVICFDRQATVSNFYFWPLPTNGGTCNATLQRTVNDANGPTDACDFPSEWTEGAIYDLADRLMDDGAMAAADPATAERIVAHAGRFRQRTLDYDRPDSTFLKPWGSRGTGRFWR